VDVTGRKEYESIGSNQRSSGNNTTSGNRSTQNQGSTNQGSNNLNSGKKKKSQRSNDSSANNTADKPAKTLTDTSVKLGKDGKLLPEERQRWIDQGFVDKRDTSSRTVLRPPITCPIPKDGRPRLQIRRQKLWLLLQIRKNNQQPRNHTTRGLR
jgi:hypothetical protein